VSEEEEVQYMSYQLSSRTRSDETYSYHNSAECENGNYWYFFIFFWPGIM